MASAPIGPSKLDRTAVALGGAVGALLASPHNASILEEGGVEFGVHKDTRSPLVIDPFAREDGYAMFTVGDPGSGKSFGSKQNFIQTIEQDPDRIGVILDQCAIKQFHKLDGMNDEIADVFGLNYTQKRFVQDAIPGSDEKGYSQALLGIDGEWRGMEVRALPRETEVIENEVSREGTAGEKRRQDRPVSAGDD